MTPDMSVNEMVDSFIYVVKGSRVIDRKATDWGAAYWLPEKHVKGHVYTVAELKRYFAHRVIIKVKKWPRSPAEKTVINPFGTWLVHPHRFTVPTLSHAMTLADMAARGLVEQRIDIDAIVERLTKTKVTPPPWERKATAA